ncbi:MAG: iron-sulfur cluster repair di-iron protein [Bacteroidales bacterium]|nr:iron-sulfur cluster repair di-iron protein [Bacteroidales bacterium]
MITPDTSIGEIVRMNFRTAQWFSDHHIDFCCGGNISISQACEKSDLSANVLIEEISAILQQDDPDSKYIDLMELDELCTYIIRRHHSYVNEKMPFILRNLDKLCEVHGENHLELFEINTLFNQVATNLTAHIKKEELILFPFISRMAKNHQVQYNKAITKGKLATTISEMEQEHTSEGGRFDSISRLSGHYKTPPDGCSTFKVTYQALQEFEQDLHRHIHLENNILFKKAVELENSYIS